MAVVMKAGICMVLRFESSGGRWDRSKLLVLIETELETIKTPDDELPGMIDWVECEDGSRNSKLGEEQREA